MLLFKWELQVRLSITSEDCEEFLCEGFFLSFFFFKYLGSNVVLQVRITSPPVYNLITIS